MMANHSLSILVYLCSGIEAGSVQIARDILGETDRKGPIRAGYMMRQLIAQGFVEERRQGIDRNRQTMRLYKITDAGRAFLATKLPPVLMHWLC